VTNSLQVGSWPLHVLLSWMYTEHAVPLGPPCEATPETLAMMLLTQCDSKTLTQPFLRRRTGRQATSGNGGASLA